MNFPRTVYGVNPNAGRPRNNAAARGWGPGWPNCNHSDWVRVTTADVSVSGIHRTLAPLLIVCFEGTETLGYDILAVGQGSCGGTWGGSCRPISGTNSPSNHSYGAAVDINAPCNPMSKTWRCDIPPVVVGLWEAADWYWGGRYTTTFDPMHFEYLGRPADVARSTARAVSYLAARKATAPTIATPGPGGSASMRFDDRDSEDVRQFQRFLNWFMHTSIEQGWSLASWRPLAVDGHFGQATQQAYAHALGRSVQYLGQPSIVSGNLNHVGPIPAAQLVTAGATLSTVALRRELTRLTDRVEQIAGQAGSGGGSVDMGAVRAEAAAAARATVERAAVDVEARIRF